MQLVSRSELVPVSVAQLAMWAFALARAAVHQVSAAKCRCLPEAEHAAAEVLMSKLGTLTSWSAAPWE